MIKHINRVDMSIVEKLSNQKVLSLTMLAIKAGVSPATIFALKAGRRNPSMKTINKIAAALGVEPSEIVKQ